MAGVLQRLDALLAQAVARTQEAVGGHDPFRGLYLGDGDVERLLATEPGTSRFDGMALESGAGLSGRLDRLGRLFGLDGFDLDLLVLAAAPDLDLRYERLYGYLQDDVTRRRPTLDLALSLLCADPAQRLARRRRLAALATAGLIRLGGEAEAPLLARPLRIDEAVLAHLLGEDELDGRLRGCATLTPPSVMAPQDVEGAVVHIAAADRAERRRAAADRADKAGRRLLALDVAAAAELDAEVPELVRVAALHAALLGAVLYVDAPDADAAWRAMANHLNGARGLVAIGASEGHPLPRLLAETAVTITLPSVGPVERRQAWVDALADHGLDADPATVEELADRFRLSGDEVADAVRAAASPHRADLLHAARVRARRDVGSLARRVELKHGWDDLVLPADAKARLLAIAQRVRLRRQVLDDWGFGDKLTNSRGATALFSGPSGTGKTMAAGILAADLGVDLYAVDLSSVVSKYIGETEKNLALLFDSIEDGMLFFDEADALFGKRSEVRDAHDRYANIEVSFLLQRMEEHEGVAILATNLRHNLDEAFVRRLAFTVGFPFPDEVSRRAIWERVFPSGAPLAADVDLDALANHKLSGGNIRNVALAAAFAAAASDTPVTMALLDEAVAQEYEKMGKGR